MGIVSQKLRDSARGQPCTFDIVDVCCRDPNRVVLCHIRDEAKGASNKANDWSAAFGCDRCHEAIDLHKLHMAEERFYILRALQRTWQIWRDMGLIVIAGDVEKPRKPSSKILPRRSMTVQP